MNKLTQRFFYTITISICLLFAVIPNSHAISVDYTLDNIFLNTGQLTGNFTWTFNEGDFEGGSGVFNELSIPRQSGLFLSPTELANLNISFDTKNSIEFSLISNLDSDGLDISLRFAQPLSETQGSLLDLSTSRYSIDGSGTNFSFTGGGISLVSPTVVPLPASAWLFSTGLIGLLGFIKRNKRHSKIT